MSLLSCAGLALLALAQGRGGEVRHVDASLDLDGTLLDRRFLDLDGDGRLELAFTLRTPRGARELRVHRIGAERVEPEPFVSVPMLEDVLAVGFAEVREDPRRELLLFTQSGIHSYSTTLPGYRDNARRLIETELFYDLPDPRALPFWDYVLPGRERDRILLPAADRLQLFGWVEQGEGASSYLILGEIASAEARRREPGRRGGQRGERERGGRRAQDRRLLFPDSFPGEERQGGEFLEAARSLRAPALADVDGDGRLDLVLLRRDALELHLGREQGIDPSPTRVEPLPAYLAQRADDTRLTLVDLDGNGALDLLAEVREGPEGFENAKYELLVLLQSGGRHFPEQPDQVLRFEAGMLRAEVADVDKDGRPDLVVRLFVLPSLVGTVTGIEFELTHLLFPGEGGGPRPFARRPALRQSERFDERSVGAAAANRSLRADLDGDGIADLVEVDLEGFVAIRRLRRSSGLARGSGWSLDTAPWKRFEVRGDISSLEVLDLNGDGIADIVSESDRTLAILLSAAGTRRER